MPDKDHDKAHDKDKHEADKREADKREAAKRATHIDNPNQDPDHPANKTPARDPKAPGPDHIQGPVYASDNLRTEQEKDATGESLGVGPLARSEHNPEPPKTMEDLGIGPRTPYPFGDPPPPSESVTYGQGVKGVTDKPRAEPSSASGPAGRAPAVDDKDAAYKADHKGRDR